jgi:hypothetical protein
VTKNLEITTLRKPADHLNHDMQQLNADEHQETYSTKQTLESSFRSAMILPEKNQRKITMRSIWLDLVFVIVLNIKSLGLLHIITIFPILSNFSFVYIRRLGTLLTFVNEDALFIISAQLSRTGGGGELASFFRSGSDHSIVLSTGLIIRLDKLLSDFDSSTAGRTSLGNLALAGCGLNFGIASGAGVRFFGTASSDGEAVTLLQTSDAVSNGAWILVSTCFGNGLGVNLYDDS